MRFLITILQALEFSVNLPWKIGVYVGVFIYEYLGFQPHYFGWFLVLITEFLAWRFLWQGSSIIALFYVNLALVALACLYLQITDKGKDSSFESNEALKIYLVHDHFNGQDVLGFVAFWVKITMSWHSSVVILLLAFAPRTGLEYGFILFNVLAAVSIGLMSLRLEGGSKGKVWEKLGQVFQMRGGIIPRPTFGSRYLKQPNTQDSNKYSYQEA